MQHGVDQRLAQRVRWALAAVVASVVPVQERHGVIELSDHGAAQFDALADGCLDVAVERRAFDGERALVGDDQRGVGEHAALLEMQRVMIRIPRDVR